jgi:formylglycine-generating enzyme required for sulfatase activity/regulator of sirC expression with transglutaminase-like and TPR domain
MQSQRVSCGRGIVFILWIGWILIAGAEAAPAPGVSLQSRIKQQLEQPPQTIDLAETLLLISKEWNPALDLDPLRKRMDELTQIARDRLQDNPSPKETVKRLRQLIHQEWGFDYTEFIDPQGFPLKPAELFIHGLLQSKRGYCMNLSLLYLILGDRLNLPLYGVALPNHFFVRYESPEYRVNIEATEGGAAHPDSFYHSRFGVSPKADYFMNRLDKKQTLGAYLSNVGLVHYRNQRVEESVFYLELSVDINPLSLDALNNLGNIYSEIKQFDRAIQSYRQALKADPSNPATLFNLGIAYTDAGQKDHAIEAFLQVARIQPEFALVHEKLYRLFLEKNKPFSALLHLKILQELEPRSLTPRMNMGTVLLEIGEYALALEQFSKTQRLFPGRMEVNERLAETYYRMDEFDKAIVQYEHLIEKVPGLTAIYVQLGWTYYRKGDFEKAIDWTRRGLEANENSSFLISLAHMNLGLFYVLQKNFPEAEQWYRKVLDNKNPEETEGMVKDLKEAVARFPTRSELWYFTGWIYHESGKTNEAQTFFKKFLTEEPEGDLAEKARALLGPASSSIIPENMIEIPKGYFIMGSNDHGDDESPEHRVYLNTFYIDKYETTAADFVEFLNQADTPNKFYKDSKFGTLSFNGNYQARPGLENHPINNVNWFGAYSYCEWKGKRLPTEAEWEKAARGTQGFIFPWGNDPISPQKARYRQEWTEEIQHGVMVPVQSLPEGKSSYGVFNMLGNVKEWVDDWYDREYYMEENHSMNPRGQIGGEYKVLKGGSWRDLRSFVYSSFRNNSYPQFQMDDYGFRCAYSEGPRKPGGPGRMTSLRTKVIRTETEFRPFPEALQHP